MKGKVRQKRRKQLRGKILQMNILNKFSPALNTSKNTTTKIETKTTNEMREEHSKAEEADGTATMKNIVKENTGERILSFSAKQQQYTRRT